jgi:hypothetical protein
LTRRPLADPLDAPLVTREGVDRAWLELDGREVDWGEHLVLPAPIQDEALTREEVDE